MYLLTENWKKQVSNNIYRTVSFFFFLFSFGHTCGLWKLPGEELNPCHHSNQSHSCDDAGSLTHWATRELEYSLDYVNAFVTKWKKFIFMVGTNMSQREETVLWKCFEMPCRHRCQQTSSSDKGKLLCMKQREEYGLLTVKRMGKKEAIGQHSYNHKWRKFNSVWLKGKPQVSP